MLYQHKDNTSFSTHTVSLDRVLASLHTPNEHIAIKQGITYNEAWWLVLVSLQFSVKYT
jgi:hypothetical protein